MKNIRTFSRLGLMIIMMTGYFGCKEEGRLDQVDSNAPAPAPLSVDNIKEIKSIPGGAVIRYKLPLDEHLSYVKAVYESSAGHYREAKASKYVDSLLLDGFSTSGTYQVKICAVGENSKESEPYTIEVNPLTPPVVEAFSTLTLEEMFGGVKGTFENRHKADLAVVLLADTLGIGHWFSLRTFYIGTPQAKFSQNGLPSKGSDFAVYLRDRWGNKSDTLIRRLTPLFEEEIPKNATNDNEGRKISDGFRKHTLPSDADDHVEASTRGDTYALNKMWDGITSNVDANIFAGLPNVPLPRTFTINLGCEAILSRIVVHQRATYEYTGATVKKFNLYGSNAEQPGDDLAPGGDWMLLGSYESVKPSGTGPVTEDDRAYANVRGENFELEETEEIPNPWVPVKFIRFQALETFGGSLASQIIIAEISLYGQIQNKE